MTEPVVRRRNRWFAPTVLVGLTGAGLAAVSGTREWASSSGDAAGIKVEATVTGSQSQPLVAALALVALAAWGVLLVVRGRVRRVVAVVGLLAAAGALAAVVLGFGTAQDDALDAVTAKGASGDVAVTSLTAWSYLAGIGALLTAAASVVAVVTAPHWPAMGCRYDAPGARRDAPAPEDDMWRALDEGRDPTS